MTERKRYDLRKKEFTLKNGLKITVKSPGKSEAAALLALVTDIAGQTPFLLSSPVDFEKRTVKEEEKYPKRYRIGT